MLRACGFRIVSTLDWGGGGGGEVRIRIVNIFNHLKRARVSCPQNFNASEQVLSKIVAVSYDSQCFGKFDFNIGKILLLHKLVTGRLSRTFQCI